MAIRGFDEILASFPRPGDRLGWAGTWREKAVLQGILPVFSDWETGYGLNANGEVLGSPDDVWARAGIVTDPVQRNAVMAQASIHFPELAYLRPERQPGDPDCTTCHGVGGFPQYPTMTCVCGNLGWVPAGQRTESP